jgi:hypothetical protein
MAKVTLPLLGVGASGSLARQLVYRLRAGMTTAAAWKGKRDAQSAAQLAQRERFRGAKAMWPYLDEDAKAEFAALVAAEHLTSWHGFLRQVLSGTVSEFTVGDSAVGGPDLIWVS